MTAADPAILAAIRQVLVEAKLLPESAPATRPPESACKVVRSEQVRCHRCGFEADRAEVRAWKWKRTREGWVCHNHAPIDFPFVAELAQIAAEELETAVMHLCEREVPESLDRIDQAAHVLEQIRGAVEPLRAR